MTVSSLSTTEVAGVANRVACTTAALGPAIPDLEAAHALYTQESFAEAKAVCEELIRRTPNRTDVLLLIGACCYQLRDTHGCIMHNRQALLIDKEFAEAYGNMANALKEQGEIDLAIELYKRAIALKPTFVDAFNNMASAYALSPCPPPSSQPSVP